MKWRGAAIGGGATSGSLGPAVASRNKGGQYLRSRVVPSGSTPTPQQEVIRNAVRSVVPQWSELTPGQRAAWNTYGVNVPITDVLGDSIQLSGQNWFNGSNVLATQTGADLVKDGPTIFNRGGVDLTGATFTAGDSVGTLTLLSPLSVLLAPETGGVLAIYCGRDYSPGRSKYFGSFQLASAKFADDTNSTLTFALPFAHVSTNQMALQLVIRREDGRYTTPSRLTVSL